MGLRLEVALPGIALPLPYFECRYTTLRGPLGFPPGAERLPDDELAVHAWWEADSGEVVAVGRIHLIGEGEDGSQADHAGPDATICPAFTPLTEGIVSLRPAVQIRQMGTRENHQRQGLAAGLVCALEATAISHWRAKTGWLQARLGAIPLYESEGWVVFGEEYDVKGIGPHLSMTKRLDAEEE
jgi:predicted GNAT family N-acyltransferase